MARPVHCLSFHLRLAVVVVGAVAAEGNLAVQQIAENILLADHLPLLPLHVHDNATTDDSDRFSPDLV
jgi:hypothetical protein